MNFTKSDTILAAGPNLRLRLVEFEDSSYITSLRIPHTGNNFISKGSSSIPQQCKWITDYKIREANQAEYYFIVENYHKERIGTVRLYNFSHGLFHWGSWILGPNKPSKAALESLILSMGFAFEALSFDTGIVSVHPLNTKAISIYKRFKMFELGALNKQILFLYSKKQYLAYKDRYISILMSNEN